MFYGISKQYADKSSHIVFNISLGLIYEQCYPLHSKTTSFCFTFVLEKKRRFDPHNIIKVYFFLELFFLGVLYAKT